METIFTKIINKEAFARIIYEDKYFIAFLDTAPNTKGHTILVPKIAAESLKELPPKVQSLFMPTAVKVAQKLEAKLFCRAFNFEVNDGEFAGQEVAHICMHIIPRYNKKERLIIRKNHNDNLDKVFDLIK